MIPSHLADTPKLAGKRDTEDGGQISGQLVHNDSDTCQLGKDRFQASLKISPFNPLLLKLEKQDCSEQVEHVSGYGLREKRPEFRAV